MVSKIVTVLAVAVAVGVTAALWPGAHPTTAPEVHLEAVSHAGGNPFLPPAGTDHAGLVGPQGTGGRFAGDTPGLYGDDPNTPSCQAQSMVAAVHTDPVKEAAWAQALNISVEDIPGFVGKLTPVVLRSDTAVTEYGYGNGNGGYLAYPAVLQAGTAALINGFGEPTVKCFNANPLRTAPDYSRAGYVGQAWQHFAPTSITFVYPMSALIENYVSVDINTGGTHPSPNPCFRDPAYCQPLPQLPGTGVPGPASQGGPAGTPSAGLPNAKPTLDPGPPVDPCAVLGNCQPTAAPQPPPDQGTEITQPRPLPQSPPKGQTEVRQPRPLPPKSTPKGHAEVKQPRELPESYSKGDTEVQQPRTMPKSAPMDDTEIEQPRPLPESSSSGDTELKARRSLPDGF